MRTKFFASLGAALGLSLHAGLVQACSVCLTGSNDPSTEGFNASVLFLMSTPYLVVGSIAGVLYFVYRRAAAKREQEDLQSMVHLALEQEDGGR